MNGFRNNVTRHLDRCAVAYETLTYTYGPDTRSAPEVAAALGLPPAQVFKTLIAAHSTDRKDILTVCLVPGPAQLDLKAVARHLEAKKVRLAEAAYAEDWSGMQTGGISPFGLLARGCTFLLDESAQAWPWIVLSAGERGRQVRLEVSAVIRVLRPAILRLSRG